MIVTLLVRFPEAVALSVPAGVPAVSSATRNGGVLVALVLTLALRVVVARSLTLALFLTSTVRLPLALALTLLMSLSVSLTLTFALTEDLPLVLCLNRTRLHTGLHEQRHHARCGQAASIAATGASASAGPRPAHRQVLWQPKHARHRGRGCAGGWRPAGASQTTDPRAQRGWRRGGRCSRMLPKRGVGVLPVHKPTLLFSTFKFS